MTGKWKRLTGLLGTVFLLCASSLVAVSCADEPTTTQRVTTSTVTAQTMTTAAAITTTEPTTTTTAPGPRRHEENDSHLHYPEPEAWFTDNSTSYSGDTSRRTGKQGAVVIAEFNGTAISYIATKQPNYGIAKITLDDGTPVLVDLWSLTISYQQTVWSASGLAPGAHTLVIESTGTKSNLSAGTAINLDALDITGTLTAFVPPTTTMITTSDGTFASLISKDKTIEDVRSSPFYTFGGPLPPAEATVPASLQSEFRSTHHGYEILYIGPYNRAKDPNRLEGNELNNALVNIGERKSAAAYATGFFGFNAYQGTTQDDGSIGYSRIAMVFKDIVPIPNSVDFYVHGVDPTYYNADIYVRIVRGSRSKYKQTLLLCFDLNSIYDPNHPEYGIGFDYGRGESRFSTDRYPTVDKKKHRAGNLSDEALAKFFVPGDTLMMWMQDSIRQEGRYFHQTIYKDENDKYIAFFAATLRHAGAAEYIKAVFGE